MTENRTRNLRDAITAETAKLPKGDHNGKPLPPPAPAAPVTEPTKPRAPRPDPSQGGSTGAAAGFAAHIDQAVRAGRLLDAIRLTHESANPNPGRTDYF